MNFTEWVEKIGGADAASKVLEEKARTVSSWLTGERAPSFKAAFNIVQKTHGLVDYNGIYRQFAAIRENKAVKEC